jgi:hypothetical protein
MMEEPQQEDYFNQKRIELMVQMATKGLVEQIEQLKTQVGMLKGQVEMVRSAPRPVEQKLVEAPVERPVQQFQQSASQSIEQPRTAQQAEDSTQRTGGYNSDDVSVEKFFNFGNK